MVPLPRLAFAIHYSAGVIVVPDLLVHAVLPDLFGGGISSLRSPSLLRLLLLWLLQQLLDGRARPFVERIRNDPDRGREKT